MRPIAPALLLALVGAAACSPDAPTAPRTVQLAVVAGADHGGRPLATEMTQEVTATPVWAGDPDGHGHALITVNLGQRTVCWELTAADILLPASAAHVHRAAPGVRGDIVVGLSAPDGSGVASGCRSGLSVQLLRDILVHPDAYYVNVHNATYPAGAIRGQLGG